jgi:hypothetical protein
MSGSTCRSRVGGGPLRRFLRRWFAANSILTGVFALVWLLLRSGPKPSRLAYPCQQAAYSAATLALGAPLVAAVIAARRRVVAGLRTRAGISAVVLAIIAPLCVWGTMARMDAGSKTLLAPPEDYRAAVFHVIDCPQDPVGDHFPGLDNLLRLMGENGLKFYQTSSITDLSGPDGIIAADDVVVVKINYQWRELGGTNTDLLRGLIRAIVDHPDGFTGEIVIGENTQWASDAGFNRSSNNSQDRTQSPRDVALDFADLGHSVSVYGWKWIRETEVDEFSEGDYSDGYVVLDYDRDFRGRVSYPKFTSAFGTSISLRDGIWDPASERYDRDRLKFINLPVLKPHSGELGYGATACVKNYMGVVTQVLNTRSHDAIRDGILGAVMREIGPADLHILDCIWISYSPAWGPMVYYDGPVTRADQLVASTDPIAADIWAVRNILIPAFEMDNFPPEPLPRPSADPEDPDSAFRIYLDNSMQQLLEGGYAVTNDFASIDVYSSDDRRRSVAPRRPTGRRSVPRAPRETP